MTHSVFVLQTMVDFRITLFYPPRKECMKICLGSTTIDPKRVNCFKRIGSRICILRFITGESITVICGVKTPDNNTISFSGTPEDLKELLAGCIETSK